MLMLGSGLAARIFDMVESMSSSRNTQRLRLAIDCLRSGKLAGADILCRNILDGEPENADTWNVLGVVAAQVSQFDRAAEYFEKAVSLGLAGAASNAEKARTAPAQRLPTPTA